MAIPQGQTSPPVPTIVLFANRNFAQANKEAVSRFVTALLRGQREFIRASASGGPAKEELIRSLQAHTPVKDVNLLCGIGLPNAEPNGTSNAAALAEVQKFFIASGAQKKPVEPARVFDPAYVAYALGRLGRAK